MAETTLRSLDQAHAFMDDPTPAFVQLQIGRPESFDFDPRLRGAAA